MFQLSATVPNIYPQPKSSLINHLVLDACQPSFRCRLDSSTSYTEFFIKPTPTPIIHVRTKIWNVRKLQSGVPRQSCLMAVHGVLARCTFKT